MTAALKHQEQRVERSSLRLNGVSKSFDRAKVLHDIQLDVAPGEFITLLGPSGCGKSTILNLVAGFIDCDAGEISIDGETITDTPTYLREIGIVFQNYALFPHMTVVRNIGYGLEMRKIPRPEIARRVTEALELVKLSDFSERRPKQLSGGQQQRVALARALVVEPKVLLLDEPFSALDKNLRGAMQVELKEIQRKTGVTTIFVTHDQDEALSMSDRIAVMSEGRIRQIATPREIYDHPVDEFVATFIGDVSIFPGRILSEKGGMQQIGVGEHCIEVPKGKQPLPVGAEVNLFARPESLELVDPNSAKGITATIAEILYQGGHVDVYLKSDRTTGGPILVRSAGASGRGFRQGDRCGVRFDLAGLSVFARTGG
jgi:putative spermidine/putrescine transport system ATP-binding protein/spermidine/putrescine transport system ATP-binding protein